MVKVTQMAVTSIMPGDSQQIGTAQLLEPLDIGIENLLDQTPAQSVHEMMPQRRQRQLCPQGDRQQQQNQSEKLRKHPDMGRKPLIQGGGISMCDESLVDIGDDTDTQSRAGKTEKHHANKGPAIMGKNHFQ